MVSLGALSFAAPAVLAALAGLPALWFLFRATPPPPRTAPFPPFPILRTLESKDETPDRTPLLLLLLRTIIAAAAIVGLSGPVLNAPPLRGEGPILFVVDDSFAAAPEWNERKTVLAQGIDEAARAGRTVYLLTTADPKRAGLVGPLAASDARARLDALGPSPFRADRAAAANALAEARPSKGGRSLDVRWLSDGVASDGDLRFLAALKAIGDVSVFEDRDAQRLILRSADASGVYRAERLGADAPFGGRITAYGRDGRILGSTSLAFSTQETAVAAELSLPLPLRNALSHVSIDGVRSAGAVVLADARDRRALVGLVSGHDASGEALLSGAHYIRKALASYAEFAAGSIDAVLQAGATVVILDDVGRIRDADAERLTAFAQTGGVVIRFAGNNFAGALDDGEVRLTPVRLRGGRAVGGPLSWETPQALGPWAANGPFATLPPAPDARVRRQVLAEPGGEATERTWASLADGTPLVTGRAEGRGAVVLFHVTATPDWSDLPLTDAFVAMLRTLTTLAAVGPPRAEAEGAALLAPVRALDGFGRLLPPAADASSMRLADASRGGSPDRPPGFYGSAIAPVAVNALAAGAPWRPVAAADGVTTRAYAGPRPVRLAGLFFGIALALFSLDAVLTLAFSGRLRRAAVVAAAAAFAAVAPLPHDSDAAAQPLDRPLDAGARAAALRTRLAFVRTGDAAVDSLSERGLSALSDTLARRTSLEPAPPAAVDPETDDLSTYPFLYWPVVAGAPAPSEAALANVENFMRFGGLVVFDTGDEERAVDGLRTPEQTALRAILSKLDTPPLTPLGPDHVLKRSFYLLQDLPGRTALNPVWVQKISGANDDVTPLIIGGRAWAAAWAAPPNGGGSIAGGDRARELALRAGVNMAMVAFTGNYKSDQVHTTALVKRLQRP